MVRLMIRMNSKKEKGSINAGKHCMRRCFEEGRVEDADC